MPTILARRTTALLCGLVLAGGLGTATVPSADAATATKKCSASMSNAKPKQYSSTSVRVGKVAGGAKVTTTAKYKTTSTKKSATAGKKGTASLPYKISGATPGHKVVVQVIAKKGSTTWTCSTSFVPRKK